MTLNAHDALAAYLHANFSQSRQNAERHADALLPLVDRLCAEAAAKALNDAADGISYAASPEAARGYDEDTQAALDDEAARLRARAAALTDVDGVQS